MAASLACSAVGQSGMSHEPGGRVVFAGNLALIHHPPIFYKKFHDPTTTYFSIMSMLNILLPSFNHCHKITTAMTDGHTAEGGWPVELSFTADQIEMLIRSIETATMMSGSNKNSTGQPQDTMQMIAYREFLKEILGTLRQALDEQKPT